MNEDEFPEILSYIRHLKPYEKLVYDSLNKDNPKLADKCRRALYLSEQISSVLAKQIMVTLVSASVSLTLCS